MPYSPDPPDTSAWGVKEWRDAKNWNIGILVGWMVFYVVAIVDCLQGEAHWLLTAIITAIGIFAFLVQTRSVIRITTRLRKQETESVNRLAENK